MKTLQDYFVASGVTDDIPWAKDVGLVNQPYAHQISGLRGALRHGRYGLFDEPGTGKTFISQAMFLYYLAFGNKTVVIMPPILLRQFEEAFDDNFVGSRKHFSFHILDQTPAKRKELYNQWNATGSWPDIICMSYQMFCLQLEKKAVVKTDNPMKKQKKRKRKTNPTTTIAGRLKDAGYSVLVADESQMLKNPTSIYYRCSKHFTGDEGDSALLLMTGTPIHNNLIDAYSPISLLTPGAYDSYKQFERKHCKFKVIKVDFDGSGKKRPIRQLTGYLNKIDLSANLYKQARRVVKKDVFKDLKDPRIIPRSVTLSKAHMTLYKKVIKERFLLVKGELLDAKTSQALRQVCLQLVTTPDRFSDKPIKNAVFEMLDELLDEVGITENKMVMFANYRESIKSLVERYKHLNPAVVYGGNSSSGKDVDRFKNDDKCRLLIANPKSGGVGLNLQKVCRYGVFVEPVSVPGDFVQAMERLWRGGQKGEVVIWILRASGTGYPKMVRDMLHKAQDTVSVLKDSNSLLNELLDNVV